MIDDKQLKESMKEFVSVKEEAFNEAFESLKSGKVDKEIELIKQRYNTDKDVYNDWIYLIENYFSYVWCSKRYALSASTVIKKDEIKSILDFGAGSGYSTALLKELYPDAVVVYYNLEGTSKDYAKKFFEDNKIDVEILDSLDMHGLNFDLIFVSEVFEHIKKPIEILKKLASINNKYFVVANSFNIKAMGHFKSFLVDGIEIENSKMARLFGKYMVNLSYKKVKTKFWNSRPNIWSKECSS